MATISRRQFLIGCSASIAAMAGACITRLAYAQPEAREDTLVVIFLRGGWDALNVVPPMDGPDRGLYQQARPGVQIPADSLLPLDDRFGLHPRLRSLHPLYQDGKLGIIHAVGLDYDTRSHFDAQEFIELGTPGAKSTTSGWITRHLASISGTGGLLPVMAAPNQPTALLGESSTASMSSIDEFSQWDNGLLAEQQAVQRILYRGDSLYHQAGQRTLQVISALSPLAGREYRPQNGASYSEDELGNQLKTVAQLIKSDVGLRVATVDFGGWDTHEYQNDGEGGYMGYLLESLGDNLANFYADLDSGHTDRLSVVVISEFGRRLEQNDANGTDHGHGSVMFTLGGGVNGGQVYGDWPGLDSDQLYDRADLAVTTDYRQVLSELLEKRLNNPAIDQVFPGYQPDADLGLFAPMA